MIFAISILQDFLYAIGIIFMLHVYPLLRPNTLISTACQHSATEKKNEANIEHTR